LQVVATAHWALQTKDEPDSHEKDTVFLQAIKKHWSLDCYGDGYN